MLKLSIFLALALGVIFAQTISAKTVMYSEDEYEDEEGDVPSEGEEEESDIEEFESTNKYESITLTCLLFDDFVCNAECSTSASAFSIQGTGQCTEQNICVCTLQRDNSLDGLIKTKFENSDGVAEEIKSNKKLATKVMQTIQFPFQTGDDAKMQLKNIVDSKIYHKLYPNDQIPAVELGLINETNELDYDKIKTYVGEKLKPLLYNSADSLKGIDYKKKLTDALKTNAGVDEDLQNIILDVRRTENQPLATVLNTFLKSYRKRETRNDREDGIADVIGYFTVDQIVKRVDQLDKQASKKPVRRQQSRTASSNQNPHLNVTRPQQQKNQMEHFVRMHTT